jgi:hypothetical protein
VLEASAPCERQAVRRCRALAGVGAGSFLSLAGELIDVSPTTNPASINAKRADKAALRVDLVARLSVTAR